MSVPQKVEKLHLRNFRGWGGERDIALENADLVLISAANGRGKSSLLEALARVLGGTRVQPDDSTIQTIGEERPPWRIGATWSGGTIKLQAGEERERSEHEPGRETVRRATLFTQDPLDNQFETDSATDDTLLGFLVPFPKWLNDYQEALKEGIRNLRKYQPRGVGQTRISRAKRRRDDVAIQLVEPLSRLLKAEAPSELEEPVERLNALAARIPGAPQTDKAGLRWARGLREAAEKLIKDSSANKQRIQQAIERKRQATERLNELDECWPPEPTQALANWTTGQVDLEQLLKLLHSLADKPSRWTHWETIETQVSRLPAPSLRLVPSLDELQHDVLSELARVDSARALRASEAVTRWKTHWEQITSRRRQLEDELKSAKAEVARLTSEVLRHEVVRLMTKLVRREEDLADAEKEADEDARRQEQWPRIQQRIDALESHNRACERLRTRQLSDDVRERVQRTMNAVMKHFVVAGLETQSDIVNVEREKELLVPNLKDGRKLLEHLSTGQKAQDALAWLLGTNALLQKWLPHHLLLLDDPSTALDLTNLAAECALLRKFAYAGDTKDDKGRKRQVVLATHHDQLTHRIYDLMLPPEGYTMREVVLQDWTLKEGPKVESYQIKSTRQATYETRKSFAKALSLAFGENA